MNNRAWSPQWTVFSWWNFCQEDCSCLDLVLFVVFFHRLGLNSDEVHIGVFLAYDIEAYPALSSHNQVLRCQRIPLYISNLSSIHWICGEFRYIDRIRRQRIWKIWEIMGE